MSFNIDTIKLYVNLYIIDEYSYELFYLYHHVCSFSYSSSGSICSLGHAPDVQLFNLYYPVKQIDRAVFVTKVG